jgi:hypothetical protein
MSNSLGAQLHQNSRYGSFDGALNLSKTNLYIIFIAEYTLKTGD